VPKCVVCGHEDKDLRKHIKEHGLSSQLYKAKFPGYTLIDEALHESLKQMWRNKANLKEKRKREKALAATLEQQGIKPAETEQKQEKDIKSPTYSGKWLEYYTSIKQKYIDEYKFAEGPELEDLLFFLVSNRQLQEEYDNLANSGSMAAVLGSDLLKNIRSNNERIQNLLVTLIEFKQTREQTQDVVNLHNETIKKAYEFIKANYGSFSYRCSSCGQMLDNFGFPHHFFEGTEKYTVFSKELWDLVVMRKIPIEYAAFVLHTSIEGLINTAALRGEPKIDVVIPEAERCLAELHDVNEA
jgi:hypothetical protein